MTLVTESPVGACLLSSYSTDSCTSQISIFTMTPAKISVDKLAKKDMI